MNEYAREWKRQIRDIVRVNNSCVNCGFHVVQSFRLQCKQAGRPISHYDDIWCNSFRFTAEQYVDEWIRSNLGSDDFSFFYGLVPIEDIPIMAEIVEIVRYRFNFNEEAKLWCKYLYNQTPLLSLTDIGDIFINKRPKIILE